MRRFRNRCKGTRRGGKAQRGGERVKWVKGHDVWKGEMGEYFKWVKRSKMGAEFTWPQSSELGEELKI